LIASDIVKFASKDIKIIGILEEAHDEQEMNKKCDWEGDDRCVSETTID